mgnify:CR=1 FL=1
MNDFGVLVRIDRPDLLPSLRGLFEALKAAKDTEEFGALDDWRGRLPEEVQSKFEWPKERELEERRSIREQHPVRIAQPEEAMGEVWPFDSVLDAVQNGEYSLLGVEQTSPETAEIRIDPEAYPYGGLGAFIAIAEAHGMYVLGVNEYGKYQERVGLPNRSNEPATRKPWWKLW